MQLRAWHLCVIQKGHHEFVEVGAGCGVEFRPGQNYHVRWVSDNTSFGPEGSSEKTLYPEDCLLGLSSA